MKPDCLQNKSVNRRKNNMAGFQELLDQISRMFGGVPVTIADTRSGAINFRISNDDVSLLISAPMSASAQEILQEAKDQEPKISSDLSRIRNAKRIVAPNIGSIPRWGREKKGASPQERQEKSRKEVPERDLLAWIRENFGLPAILRRHRGDRLAFNISMGDIMILEISAPAYLTPDMIRSYLKEDETKLRETITRLAAKTLAQLTAQASTGAGNGKSHSGDQGSPDHPEGSKERAPHGGNMPPSGSASAPGASNYDPAGSSAGSPLDQISRLFGLPVTIRRTSGRNVRFRMAPGPTLHITAPSCISLKTVLESAENKKAEIEAMIRSSGYMHSSDHDNAGETGSAAPSTTSSGDFQDLSEDCPIRKLWDMFGIPATIRYTSGYRIGFRVKDSDNGLILCVSAPAAASTADILKSARNCSEDIKRLLSSRKQAQDTTEFVPGFDRDEDTLRELANQAAKELPPLVKLYAGRAGVVCNRIAIKLLRSRWGSCSAMKNINLSVLIILLPRELRDAVVAHEVSHLIELNHSPRFYQVCHRICPDYDQKIAKVRELEKGIWDRAFGYRRNKENPESSPEQDTAGSSS